MRYATLVDRDFVDSSGEFSEIQLPVGNWNFRLLEKTFGHDDALQSNDIFFVNQLT